MGSSWVWSKLCLWGGFLIGATGLGAVALGDGVGIWSGVDPDPQDDLGAGAGAVLDSDELLDAAF